MSHVHDYDYRGECSCGDEKPRGGEYQSFQQRLRDDRKREEETEARIVRAETNTAREYARVVELLGALEAMEQRAEKAEAAVTELREALEFAGGRVAEWGNKEDCAVINAALAKYPTKEKP